MTILEKIAGEKRKEILLLKKRVTIKDFENDPMFRREIIPLSERLKNQNDTGIIAEFKRASPSHGIINDRSGIVEVTTGYTAGGASGLSILTDSVFFGGGADDLLVARKACDLPILRKDFIIDEIQIFESKCLGADVILLISSLLGAKKVLEYSKVARSAGLEVLLELHSPEEIDSINDYVNIIGINNRDLNTMKVDVNTSYMMADQIPAGRLKISESGISSLEVIRELRKEGFNGFLIGEYFMSKNDPVAAFCDFTRDLNGNINKQQG